MKNVIVYGLLTVAVMGWSPLTLAVIEESTACQLNFPVDSAKVDEESLKTCAQLLKLKPGDKVVVDGFASKDGEKEHNKELSEQRAKNTAEEIEKIVSGLNVEFRGLGERDSESRVALMLSEDKSVASDVPTGPQVAAVEEPAVTATVKSVEEPVAPFYNWRVAVRLGADKTRIESKRHYFVPGLDVAYLPRFANENIRLELGAVANFYTREVANKFSSYHFSPLLGFQSSGFVIGVRGLAGTLHSNATDKDYSDSGAELRLGYEKDRLSLFVGAGRTDNVERLGLDVGARF
jgi:hypothetical protein